MFCVSVSSCEVVGEPFLDVDVHVCVVDFLCEWCEGDSVEGLTYVYGSKKSAICRFGGVQAFEYGLIECGE